MKIGFWFDYDHTWTFTALYQGLAARIPGLTTCGFVMNDRYLDHARAHTPRGTRIEPFYDHYRAGLASRPSEAELAEFRAFDERRNLARIAYSDRHLGEFSYEQTLAALIHLRKVYADFLDTEKPDAFVFNCIASHSSHLFYEMLLERGIRPVVFSFFGVDDCVYLADNPFLDCPDIWDRFAQFRDGRDTPSAEESAFADRFIAWVREGKPAYHNPAVTTEQRKFGLPGPAALARYLTNHWKYYRGDPTQPSILTKAVKPLRLRWYRRQAKASLSPASILDAGPFLYLPLHYEPEIATLVISPCDQTSVIDLIARRIPATWRILAKEHPAMAGQRPPAYYATIRQRNPNVFFVEAGVPSLELARRAEAIFTLTGTVAIEAAVLGRPTILQARSRFGGFGVIPRMIDPFAFETVLEAARAAPPRIEDVRLMLAAIARHCYRFRFAEPLGDPSILEADNIAAITDAVADHLGLGGPATV